MPTSITLNGYTATLRDFSTADKRSFLTRNKEQLIDKLRPDFPDLTDIASHAPSQTITRNGLTARIHFAAQKEPRFTIVPAGAPGERLLDNRSKVVSAVTMALEIFAPSDHLKLPNNCIDIFIAEESDVSLGYEWWDGVKQNAAVVLGKTAASYGGNPSLKPVAQEVYEHYRPSLTINALEKRILAILVHEMGHVFHQINSREKYILMARCQETLMVPDNAPPPLAFSDLQATTRLQVEQVLQETKKVAKGVSPYAWWCGLNEFVAEVFCAKVMGSPYGNGTPIAALTGGTATKDEIDSAYTECGGPEPEPTICHRRRE